MTITACGSEDIDQTIVDQNQIISRSNGLFNANRYAKKVHGADVKTIMGDSDSTIDSSCRYGDGWMSATVVLKDDSEIGLKCQTTGSGKGNEGCLTDDAFATKDYEDGSCDSGIKSLQKFGG